MTGDRRNAFFSESPSDPTATLFFTGDNGEITGRLWYDREYADANGGRGWRLDMLSEILHNPYMPDIQIWSQVGTKDTYTWKAERRAWPVIPRIHKSVNDPYYYYFFTDLPLEVQNLVTHLSTAEQALGSDDKTQINTQNLIRAFFLRSLIHRKKITDPSLTLEDLKFLNPYIDQAHQQYIQGVSVPGIDPDVAPLFSEGSGAQIETIATYFKDPTAYLEGQRTSAKGNMITRGYSENDATSILWYDTNPSYKNSLTGHTNGTIDQFIMASQSENQLTVLQYSATAMDNVYASLCLSQEDGLRENNQNFYNFFL